MAQGPDDFRVPFGSGEQEDVLLRIEFADDLVDALDKGTDDVEIRDVTTVIVIVHPLRDPVGAQHDMGVVRHLRLIFFEMESHLFETVIHRVVVDDLAHRVDIVLLLKEVFDLVDRPFHAKAESGMFREDDLYISSMSHNSWTFFQMSSEAASSSFFLRVPSVKPSSS